MQTEVLRLQAAVNALRSDLDRMLERRDLVHRGEHRDVLEAFRMVAYDRGGMHKLTAAVMTGLTAEADSGCCGGRYGLILRDRFGCLNHHRRGTCANTQTIRREKIEQRGPLRSHG